MALSFMVPALFIALVVLVVAGIRLGSENGGEDMIKNVYVYLVLFATLMMTIGGSIAALMAIADIIAPAPYYQSYAEFEYRGLEQVEQPYAGTEAEKKYEAAVLAHKEEQIGRARNALVKSFSWIVVSLPVFVYFQRRLAHKEHESA